MLKHIVVWKFKDEAEGKSRAENCALVRERLLALVGVIPEVKHMEIGIDIGSIQGNFDLALIVETDNTDTLSAYANHPEHLKVVDYIKKVVEQRVAVDFTF